MRVLLCAPHFAPFFEGGTESVIRASAKELRALGHDVLVLAGLDQVLARDQWPGELFFVEQLVDGIPVRFIPRLATAEGDLSEALEDMLIVRRPLALELVLQVAEEFAPAIVHVHHHAFLAGGLVAALAQEGFPVALSFHDLFLTCPRFFRVPVQRESCPPLSDVEGCATCLERDSAGVPIDILQAGLVERREFFRREVESANLLISPSAHHAARVAALFGIDARRIRVVPNGLVRKIERAVAPPLRRPGDPLHIFHHGHRAQVKGTLDLVKALALVANETDCELTLTLAGGEMEEDYDSNLRAEAGAVTLKFVGTFTGPELPGLARGAHLAAFPSRAPESYGLVVDEAFALGLPVLVSDSGALPERICPRGSGWPAAGQVLPACNPRAWADAITTLVRDPAVITRWRAALPSTMPSPREATSLLLPLYHEILPPTGKP
jgi:glycosyltransferase involved in cell wall biosynthesis